MQRHWMQPTPAHAEPPRRDYIIYRAGCIIVEDASPGTTPREKNISVSSRE